MAHDPRHEEWMVDRMSGGGLSEQHRAELDNCAHCRGLEADLRAITRSLDRAGAHERAVVERLAREDGRTASNSGREPRRFATWWPLAAAALILVGVFAWSRFPRPDGSPKIEGPGPMLGGGSIGDLAPNGAVAAIESFRFAADRPPGGEFRVRVYDPASGVLVVESPPLEDAAWTPDAAERARIPDAFRWKAVVIDSSGVELASATADVTLRAR